MDYSYEIVIPSGKIGLLKDLLTVALDALADDESLLAALAREILGELK